LFEEQSACFSTIAIAYGVIYVPIFVYLLQNEGRIAAPRNLKECAISVVKVVLQVTAMNFAQKDMNKRPLETTIGLMSPAIIYSTFLALDFLKRRRLAV